MDVSFVSHTDIMLISPASGGLQLNRKTVFERL